jgi:hypothetical protein
MRSGEPDRPAVCPGMIVQSKAGHDRMNIFLVMQVRQDRVWLTDGSSRPVEKQKKKNIRHVKVFDKRIQSDILQILQDLGDTGQQNAAVRRLLAPCTEQAGRKNTAEAPQASLLEEEI